MDLSPNIVNYLAVCYAPTEVTAVTVETLDEWYQQAKTLHELNYFVVTMQYAVDSPHGYHVTFMSKNSDKKVEIITHSAEVQNAIYAF